MMEEKKEEKHSFDTIEETLNNVNSKGSAKIIPSEFDQIEKEMDKSQEDKEPLLQFFAYEHLHEKLQAYSKPIGELARHLCRVLPRNPERTVMLRKLIEAKDCAVRAYIYEEPKK